MLGEYGCSGATRSLPHFGCPGVWEGGQSICFPLPPPRVAGCCSSDTLDPLDSGGSLSLCWTTDMKQHSVHTHAVQPSYSWARLSKLVASLITKSTCKTQHGNSSGTIFYGFCIYSPHLFFVKSDWGSDKEVGKMIRRTNQENC